jgi:hypothetical protein
MRNVLASRSLTDEEVITWARLGAVVVIFLAVGAMLEAWGFANRAQNLPLFPTLLGAGLPLVALGALLFFSPNRLLDPDGDGWAPLLLAGVLLAALLGLAVYAAYEPVLHARMDAGLLAFPRVLVSASILAAIGLLVVLTLGERVSRRHRALVAIVLGLAITVGGKALLLFDPPWPADLTWQPWIVSSVTSLGLGFGLLLFGVRMVAPGLARSLAWAGAIVSVLGIVWHLAWIFLEVSPELVLSTLVSRLSLALLFLAIGGALTPLLTRKLVLLCVPLVVAAAAVVSLWMISAGALVLLPVAITGSGVYLLLAVIVSEVWDRTEVPATERLEAGV